MTQMFVAAHKAWTSALQVNLQLSIVRSTCPQLMGLDSALDSVTPVVSSGRELRDQIDEEPGPSSRANALRPRVGVVEQHALDPGA